jgi:hypothetical protein
LVGLAAGETINEARGKFGLPPVASGDVVPAIAGDVSERAVYWANSRAASLVQQIEGNTRGMLSASVVEAVAVGLAGTALVSAIADSAAFSEARVDSIATTELLGASNAGNLAVFTGSNVATGKRWVTMDDDDVEEICQANEDAGVIGLNDSFPSGHLAPLAHPNCRCYLEAAFIDPDAVSAALKAGQRHSNFDISRATRRAISTRDLLIGHLQLRKARAGDRPVDLPVADEDTRIQVDHIAWQRVQSPDFVLIDGVVPMADLVATQDVVDGARVDRYAEIYRENEDLPPFDRPPIVLEHEGSAMILDGHHRVEAAKQAGATALSVAFLEEDEPPGPSFDWTELEHALAPLAVAGRE